MHAVTRDYKRTEQNGVPLSNPSLVMTSYSLWTTSSWLLWAVRAHHHDYPMKFWSRSTYNIATVCPSCSWLHIHTVASSFPTAAMCVIANSMANSSSISAWQSHVSLLSWLHIFAKSFEKKHLPMKGCYLILTGFSDYQGYTQLVSLAA